MILEAKNIYKSYDLPGDRKIEILKGVNISIDYNQTIAIKGASGSGKSTLLNILATIDNYDSGSLEYHLDSIIDPFSINDRDLSNLRVNNIGFVFQFHHLLQEFSAIENILLPKMIKGRVTKSDNDAAKEILDLVGVIDRKDHKPSELSGGEQQRVAIARALINDPKIVFADEPTGNLDEKNTEAVLDLIDSIKKKFSMSFIIATHTEEVALRADTILYLHNGILTNK